MPTYFLLLTALMETANTFALDALRALPAALARVMLGWKTEPGVRVIATAFQKTTALIGSISLAVMAGDVTRGFASTRDLAPLIVIAVAFNAQHVAARMIVLSNEKLRSIEKRAKRHVGEE